MIYFHRIRGTDDGNHYGLIHGWNRNDQQFARFRPDLHDPQSGRADQSARRNRLHSARKFSVFKRFGQVDSN